MIFISSVGVQDSEISKGKCQGDKRMEQTVK